MMMTMIPILETPHGRLFQADCLDFLGSLDSESVDLAFADPPFNLGKEYSSKIDDNRSREAYLYWCVRWLDEMVRSLKPGGALFLWNLPMWNLQLGAHLASKLTFRHWVAVDLKYSLPIKNRLYPSHYSLLYFVKGEKPAVFHPDRTPVPCCRHCGGELRDYGGYKDKMNPEGVSLSDVWTDISPVRHAKYKKRRANALPLKLMDRIVSMASDEGSLVLDPFGGSGTTYVAAELTRRQWVGCELECSAILDRFDRIDLDREHLADIQEDKNTLFTDADLERRVRAGLPLSPKYKLKSKDGRCTCPSMTSSSSLELFTSDV
ncbi:MAG TPA: site-specific DNA-methyltransferase [Castellaniella sp.]|uniref:DNA-methyltransferase n=1 Tax=Castellaniella sp. TaxID=1955812 RepID=UPI002F0351C8